jgi:peptidoglycan/LPS O-acetylase OafA/YrhL
VKYDSRIRGFDGIRCLAVAAVVAAHLELLKSIEGTRVSPLLDGGTGVSAFFVLSGFLITMLMIRETDIAGSISISSFYGRRILRIVPLYALFLAAVLVVVALRQPVADFKTLLAASTYTYNFVPRSWFSVVLNHTWSLAVEEHFYLLWPFVFLFLYPRSPRLLVGLCAALFVCSYLFFVEIDSYWRWRTQFSFDRWTMVAGSNILAGCVMALLIMGGRRSLVATEIIKSRVSLVIGVCLFANTIIVAKLPSHLDGYIRAIGITLIVGWLFLNQTSTLARVLEFRPLRFLGLISYGIYIWQGFFIGSEPQRSANQAWPPPLWLGLLMVLVVSPVSYYLFERPIMRMGRRILREHAARRQRPAVADVAQPIPVLLLRPLTLRPWSEQTSGTLVQGNSPMQQEAGPCGRPPLQGAKEIIDADSPTPRANTRPDI